MATPAKPAEYLLNTAIDCGMASEAMAPNDPGVTPRS
jgi:hypothetical protein